MYFLGLFIFNPLEKNKAIGYVSGVQGILKDPLVSFCLSLMDFIG